MKEQLSALLARLPELEWSASKLHALALQKQLPKGLFAVAGEELSVALCIKEIRADICLLEEQTSDTSASYLAEKIKQKINVLVILCQLDSRKKKQTVTHSLSVSMLSTRQQWLQHLEQDMYSLQQQHQALKNTLAQLQPNADSSTVLHLKKELGEVAQRLTVAQETFKECVRS